MGGPVVQNEIEFTLRVSLHDAAYESDEGSAIVLLDALPNDTSSVDSEGSNQVHNPVSLILELDASVAVWPGWRLRPRALQRLDASLLINAEQDAVLRWVEVQVDDSLLLFIEVRVMTREPVLDTVRFDVGSTKPERNGLAAYGRKDPLRYQFVGQQIHGPTCIRERGRPDQSSEDVVSLRRGEPLRTP